MTDRTIVKLNSRIREFIPTIFDVYCVLRAYPTTELIRKYPEDFGDVAIINSVKKFAVPCDMRRTIDEEDPQFFFVLTDSSSYFTFGFCLYNKAEDFCYCILSGNFMPSFFFTILSYINKSKDFAEEEAFLTEIYHSELPTQGRFVIGASLPVKWNCQIPNFHSHLPNNRLDPFVGKFFATFDSNVLLICLFASILKERRIIITAEKLSTVSACVHGCSTLLLPMYWQSLFIPILPESMIETLMAPMPYLIGLPKHLLESASHLDIAPVVIYDADAKTLHSPFNDHEIFPSEISARLRQSLKQANGMKNDPVARYNNASNAFFCSNAFLFGGYRTLFYREGTSHSPGWDVDTYLQKQPASFRKFLESLLGHDGVQYFEKFLSENKDNANTVEGCDIFEKEHKKAMQKRFQASTTEVLQDAMSSIKENASDVLGSLKGKISGTNIRQKLNRLAVSREKKQEGKTPMSFENSHWFVESVEENGEPTSSTTASEDVAIADLIDFSDPPAANPPKEACDDLLASLNLSGQPILTTKQNASFVEFGSAPSSVNQLLGTFMSPFEDIHETTPNKPTVNAVNEQRKKWETFE